MKNRISYFKMTVLCVVPGILTGIWLGIINDSYKNKTTNEPYINRFIQRKFKNNNDKTEN